MTINEVLDEINNGCENLCFVPDSIKTGIVQDEADIRLEGESRMLFHLIQSSMEIINGTQIYSQDSIINSFVSTLTIEGSQLYEISLLEPSIQVTTSNLTLNDMQIHTITNPQNVRFIVVSLDSNFVTDGVDYRSSNSVLFTLSSSVIQASNLSFNNITNAEYLVVMYDVKNTVFRNLSMVNVSSSKDSLIDVKKSTGLPFINVTVSELANQVIKVSDSKLNEMSNLHIHSSLKALRIDKSTISALTDSTFNGNGGLDTASGGAVKFYNSDVSIVNTSFTGNSAEVGAAIHFDCNSAILCKLSVDS